MAEQRLEEKHTGQQAEKQQRHCKRRHAGHDLKADEARDHHQGEEARNENPYRTQEAKYYDPGCAHHSENDVGIDQRDRDASGKQRTCDEDQGQH